MEPVGGLGSVSHLVWGRAWLAALLISAGGAALAGGFLGLAFVPPSIAGFSGPVVADIAGGVLLLVGLIVATRAWAKDEAPAPSIPAHVAFSRRQEQPMVVPDIKKPTPRATKHAGLIEIDDQIREVTKKINRASVMLATGKLSDAGYTRYVDALKTQRGSLESERVKKELKGGG